MTEIYTIEDLKEHKHFSESQNFTEYALIALKTIIDKLKKKKLEYNFDLMLDDFTKLINEWKNKN